MADDRIRRTVRLSTNADSQIKPLRKHFNLKSDNEVYEYLLVNHTSIVSDIRKRHFNKVRQKEAEIEKLKARIVELEQAVDGFFNDNRQLKEDLNSLRMAIDNFLFGKERLVELLRGGESRGFDAIETYPDDNFLEPHK